RHRAFRRLPRKNFATFSALPSRSLEAFRPSPATPHPLLNMKLPTSFRRLALSAIAILAVLPLRAQYAPPPPARPFPGFANEKLRADNVYMSSWDIGASFRVRFEDKLGAGF